MSGKHSVNDELMLGMVGLLAKGSVDAAGNKQIAAIMWFPSVLQRNQGYRYWITCEKKTLVE